MVHDVGEPVVARLYSDDDAAFARSLGDWRDSCQTAQGGLPLASLFDFLTPQVAYTMSGAGVLQNLVAA
jgi:hypothetical protein